MKLLWEMVGQAGMNQSILVGEREEEITTAHGTWTIGLGLVP